MGRDWVRLGDHLNLKIQHTFPLSIFIFLFFVGLLVFSFVLLANGVKCSVNLASLTNQRKSENQITKNIHLPQESCWGCGDKKNKRMNEKSTCHAALETGRSQLSVRLVLSRLCSLLRCHCFRQQFGFVRVCREREREGQASGVWVHTLTLSAAATFSSQIKNVSNKRLLVCSIAYFCAHSTRAQLSLWATYS